MKLPNYLSLILALVACHSVSLSWAQEDSAKEPREPPAPRKPQFFDSPKGSRPSQEGEGSQPDPPKDVGTGANPGKFGQYVPYHKIPRSRPRPEESPSDPSSPRDDRPGSQKRFPSIKSPANDLAFEEHGPKADKKPGTSGGGGPLDSVLGVLRGGKDGCGPLGPVTGLLGGGKKGDDKAGEKKESDKEGEQKGGDKAGQEIMLGGLLQSLLANLPKT